MEIISGLLQLIFGAYIAWIFSNLFYSAMRNPAARETIMEPLSRLSERTQLVLLAVLALIGFVICLIGIETIATSFD